MRLCIMSPLHQSYNGGVCSGFSKKSHCYAVQIVEYEPLLDSCDMTFDDWIRIASDIRKVGQGENWSSSTPWLYFGELFSLEEFWKECLFSIERSWILIAFSIDCAQSFLSLGIS